MKRILFDQSTPRPLRRYLTKHMVQTAAELGWERLNNGALLSAAEQAGFDVFLTGDRNIPSQQTMKGRKLAVLCMTANNWPIVQPHVQNVVGCGRQRRARNGEGCRVWRVPAAQKERRYGPILTVRRKTESEASPEIGQPKAQARPSSTSTPAPDIP